MSGEETKSKIGTGHVSAMFRQGLSELRAAMYPDSNVAQPPQYGLYGTKTPGEVMEEKMAEMRDPDERPSIIDERSQPEERGGNGRRPEPPQHEKE